MKKRLNSTFFGICFLAAILAEVYCMEILKDPFSILGIGVVVLITGYLLLDSIISHWKEQSDRTKFLLENLYREEIEKWNDRYTEILNIQKASYASAKKSYAMLDERFEELTHMLSSMENSNTEALLKITDLQKKTMEGQKNALNLEINYNKENTKQLIKVLREESAKAELCSQLKAITDLIEKNQAFLRKSLENISIGKSLWLEQEIESGSQAYIEAATRADFETTLEAASETDLTAMEAASEIDLTAYSEPDVETDMEDDSKPADNRPEIVPLYDDPNKALTADEIAALFASFGR